MLKSTKKSHFKRDKLSTHKKKAWKSFSLFIRTRDSIQTTGGIDQCVCVTCPAIKSRLGIDCIQAGHFPELAGRTNSVLFCEQGVHGQCYQCNHHKHGNPKPYMEFMVATYGQEIVDALIFESHKTVVYTAEDYDNIATEYSRKTALLLADMIY